jgi:hypothetical protein
MNGTVRSKEARQTRPEQTYAGRRLGGVEYHALAAVASVTSLPPDSSESQQMVPWKCHDGAKDASDVEFWP